jgi:hypothetical protein
MRGVQAKESKLNSHPPIPSGARPTDTALQPTATRVPAGALPPTRLSEPSASTGLAPHQGILASQRQSVASLSEYRLDGSAEPGLATLTETEALAPSQATEAVFDGEEEDAVPTISMGFAGSASPAASVAYLQPGGFPMTPLAFGGFAGMESAIPPRVEVCGCWAIGTGVWAWRGG